MKAKTVLLTVGTALQVIGTLILLVSYWRGAKRRKALLEMFKNQEKP